jgi:hypothetical protein
MYCLTIRDVYNNQWADNFYFETKEEADIWSNAIKSLFDNKEGFEGYQWEVTKVSLTEMTLDEFMKGCDMLKCNNTPVACPEYVRLDEVYCYKCRS